MIVLSVILHEGDCLDILKTLPSESIDSVVTDPPAGISFMGKAWDTNKGGRDHWIIWMAEIAAECLRVIKPGGHALVWALPRTSHWTATAWENAGWEVRDRVAHLFGSGFPKSHNLDGDWEGWGTALKPACEDWWLLRKPLIGTVAENVLMHSTGAMNIDACRVDHITVDGGSLATNPHLRTHINGGNGGHIIASETERRVVTPHLAGRWPANVVHDGSDEVMEAFAAYGERGAAAPVKGHEPSRTGENGIYNHWERVPGKFYDDTGTAARFYYCAKSSKAERNGSRHPTIKPLNLMAYLCRLVTPRGGTVLDLFAGSGTTGQAAIDEGFQAILIEREADYCKDIRLRLALWLEDS